MENEDYREMEEVILENEETIKSPSKAKNIQGPQLPRA